MNEAETNVQSMEIAKNNGRNLLDHAYRLFEDFYHQLNCDQKTNFLYLHHVAEEPIDDRNILLYLASIESCVQHILPLVKIHRKSGGRLGHHHHLDETMISWRIDQRHPDQPSNNRSYQYDTNLAHLDAMIPQIPE